MPQSQIHPSPLCAAVRTLFDRHRIEPASGDAPQVYVLGDKPGGWTIEDVLPVSILLGWRAPPSSWALVVIASGHAWRLDPDADPASEPEGGAPSGPAVSIGWDSGPGPAVPVALAVGVDRTGATASRLTGVEAITAANPAGGRLVDTLRRNLDVPTPAAPEGTARFLAVAWLAAVRGATFIRPASAGWASDGHAAAASALGWPAVLRLHPAARLLSARGEHLSTTELEGVVELAQSTWTWDVLRRAESTNASIVPLCPPGAASWMDSGMYARWVLADLPPTGSVWGAVRPVLTPVARRRLQGWFQRNGIDLGLGPSRGRHYEPAGAGDPVGGPDRPPPGS
jgi:hypothetical protein